MPAGALPRASPTELATEGLIWTHDTPTQPAVLTRCGLGDLSLPRAKPVNIKLEDGGETHTGVQRRHGDSMSPIVHVVFTHAQPPRCARRADAGPFERLVEASGQGTPEAVVLDTPLEVTNIRGLSIHRASISQSFIFMPFSTASVEASRQTTRSSLRPRDDILNSPVTITGIGNS